MTTIESIQQAYIDFVLTQGETPRSLYTFAGKNNLSEEEFHRFFVSFEGLEQNIWTGFAVKTVAEVKSQHAWRIFIAREKALSFFYTFFEMLKGSRSFVVYSIKKQPKTFSSTQIFSGLKDVFDHLCNDIILEGIESDELSDRKFFTNRYKDALWVQLLFVLNYWINDNSTRFEKTNEAIEKGINVTFDLFQRSPIDNLFEFTRFLTRKRQLRQKLSFGHN
ncbi:MAG: TetR family transcriptional regulator C-terminal domain-containing protein [Bacteroidota bacterium]|nr:TetR family transcriptional regulator C-terminal domain-containing protein [Bacteroidota bacterium]